jgi:hypothetical protein
MEGTMFGLKKLDSLFVGWAFFFQIALIIHFAVRKRFFETYTLKFGWIVYALCIPAVIISLIFLRADKPWYFWLGGFLFLLFAIYGYYIDYIQQISWRSPVVPGILVPYVTLYLATIMFYWWPLLRINRTLWFVYAGLYVISTILNITSH